MTDGQKITRMGISLGKHLNLLAIPTPSSIAKKFIPTSGTINLKRFFGHEQ